MSSGGGSAGTRRQGSAVGEKIEFDAGLSTFTDGRMLCVIFDGREDVEQGRVIFDGREDVVPPPAQQGPRVVVQGRIVEQGEQEVWLFR